jgi:xylan 1,4-beta-xylosidase
MCSIEKTRISPTEAPPSGGRSWQFCAKSALPAVPLNVAEPDAGMAPAIIRRRLTKNRGANSNRNTPLLKSALTPRLFNSFHFSDGNISCIGRHPIHFAPLHFRDSSGFDAKAASSHCDANRQIRFDTLIGTGFCVSRRKQSTSHFPVPYTLDHLRNRFLGLFATFFFTLLLLALSQPASSQEKIVHVRIDASHSLGALPAIWAFFGYDEPNYTYMPHGKELISELTALSPVTVQIRAHNLLTTGDGAPALKWGSTNAYTEDASGNPVYDWKIIDRIFTTYLDAGAKPFVEIGFMPEALSTHPEPYQHTWPKGELFTGWSYPPKDYAKWAELVRQLVLHSVQRYGVSEVASWKFEVWNEPDIAYWHGTAEEYDKLYDFTAAGVKKAFPAAHVGGPTTTGPGNPKAAEYLRQFLEHCARGKNYATGETGSPLDFITFHAKGSPKFVDGHEEMGIAAQLRSVDRGLEIIGSFPEFAKLPVIISESDPDGCAGCASHFYSQYSYRNGTQYPAYTAAVFRATLDLAQRHNSNVAGMLTWAFEFEDQPYFQGFRTLATNGIDKPELNFFRMAGKLGGESTANMIPGEQILDSTRGERIAAESSGAENPDSILQSGVRGQSDVDVVATKSNRKIDVMVWNYQDADVAGPAVPVTVHLFGLPESVSRLGLRHYRIDSAHSNSYSAWLAMGSPQNPSAEQLAQLKSAGQLQLLESPRSIRSRKGTADISFPMPRQAISLLELTW